MNAEVVDTATGQKGTIVGANIYPKELVLYSFQPPGLNEDGLPRVASWIDEGRFIDPPLESLDLPLEVLLTEVEDVPTGYKGMAVSLVVHISGCIHIEIQPKGLTKSGDTIRPRNFDYRRCRGEKVKVLTPVERKESQAVRPSPGDMDMDQRFPSLS